MRTENGKLLQHTPVVAADLVATLSGVAFGSVLKVIMAIHAIEEHTESSFRDILDPRALPTELADDCRWRETEKYVLPLVDKITDKDVRNILRLNNRFVKAG